jgi:hypothetical protein
MGDRRAQEFWDRMWLWEKYEAFPTETVDDPHLVIQLSTEVDGAGGNVDSVLFSRYDNCVGRVTQRLTNEFPRTSDSLDETELKNWLTFGLRSDVRGHDQSISPIIDADSLVIFRFFVNHALKFAVWHGLNDLQAIWQRVETIAKDVDDSRQRGRPTRFGNVK